LKKAELHPGYSILGDDHLELYLDLMLAQFLAVASAQQARWDGDEK
jgi:hypothetical protein